MKKIYWLARHDMSPIQLRAIKEIHGNVEIKRINPVYATPVGLAEFIKLHADGFTYAEASELQCLNAAIRGCVFGIFQERDQVLPDGSRDLTAVQHVSVTGSNCVWQNPEPASGERICRSAA